MLSITSLIPTAIPNIIIIFVCVPPVCHPNAPPSPIITVVFFIFNTTAVLSPLHPQIIIQHHFYIRSIR
eukprot:m.35325 g.35325  ORF g.35325 m.35325 type:complete len:69 (-) comp11128_c1_seq1:400-606(-)